MRTRYFIVGAIIVIFGLAGAWWYLGQSSNTPNGTLSTNTYGMHQYSDLAYNFSFWYPSGLQITASTTHDEILFPGGTLVEKLQIGEEGNTTIFVVNAPNGTITDEPAGHASPIPQTKYFYDQASSTWMITFPDSMSEVGARATTTADISNTTIAGLLMLPSGRRFNTTIIPLSTTRFIVVTDGGGSTFTPQLAKTVTRTDSSVDLSVQLSALQAEADAYAHQ